MATTYTPRLSWTKLPSGHKVPLFYDHHLKLVDAFHLYIVRLAKQKIEEAGSLTAYDSTVEASAYVLLALLEYLTTIGKNWTEVDDEELVKFRDWEYNRILRKSNSKGAKKTACRTMNVKLRLIYRFYNAIQEEMGLLENHIGMTDCKITSVLPLEKRHLDKFGQVLDLGGAATAEKRRFPKLYRHVGEGSRTREQYVVTEEDIKKLIRYFSDATRFAPEVTRRNYLLMAVLENVGWRRGSIASLTTDQFSREKIADAVKKGRDYILVTPAMQKFGMDNTFEVKIPLANQIAEYIEKDRTELMQAKGWTEEQAQSTLWLSMNDGKPLSPERITDIFSRETFRKAGIIVPRTMDAGPHCFRRKFGQDSIVAEVAVHKANDIPISPLDIGLNTARKMGHLDPKSLLAYVYKAEEGATADSVIKELQEMVRDLQAQVRELTVEKMHLEQLIERGQ